MTAAASRRSAHADAGARVRAQLRVEPIADLESYLPPSGAGWGGEKPAAVAAEPEAPRRSLRARTERTYVDGEDDEDDERSVSEDEPMPQAPARPNPLPAQPAQPAAAPAPAAAPSGAG